MSSGFGGPAWAGATPAVADPSGKEAGEDVGAAEGTEDGEQPDEDTKDAGTRPPRDDGGGAPAAGSASTSRPEGEEEARARSKPYPELVFQEAHERALRQRLERAWSGAPDIVPWRPAPVGNDRMSVLERKLWSARYRIAARHLGILTFEVQMEAALADLMAARDQKAADEAIRLMDGLGKAGLDLSRLTDLIEQTGDAREALRLLLAGPEEDGG